MARSDDPETSQALLGALEALTAAILRHDKARTSPSRETEAFGSLVEASWWVASLDEQLTAEHGALYRALRSSHEDGDAVLAMLWARDRHYHQLPYSVEDDPQAPTWPVVFGGPMLSAGLVWKSREQLSRFGDRTKVRGAGEAFDRAAAGTRTTTPLMRSLRFFCWLGEPEQGMLPAHRPWNW